MFEICIHQTIDQLAFMEIYVEPLGKRLLQVVGVPNWPIRVRTVRRRECGVVRTSRLEKKINKITPKFIIQR